MYATFFTSLSQITNPYLVWMGVLVPPFALLLLPKKYSVKEKSVCKWLPGCAPELEKEAFLLFRVQPIRFCRLWPPGQKVEEEMKKPNFCLELPQDWNSPEKEVTLNCLNSKLEFTFWSTNPQFHVAPVAIQKGILWPENSALLVQISCCECLASMWLQRRKLHLAPLKIRMYVDLPVMGQESVPDNDTKFWPQRIRNKFVFLFHGGSSYLRLYN